MVALLIIYEVISILLGLGLVFYLINRIFRRVHFKVRGLVTLIVGFILAVAFGISLVFDYNGGNILIEYYYYFLFIIISLGYGIGISYKCLHYDRGRKVFGKKVVNKYDFTDYLYVFYRFQNTVYLKQNKESYEGLLFKLKETDYHDSFIADLNNKYHITIPVDVERIGKLADRTKRRIYHCYVINLSSNLSLEKLEKLDAYRLTKYQIDDFDKNFIYRMIVKEKFDIEN